MIIAPMGVGKMIDKRGNVGVLAKTEMFPLQKQTRFMRVFFLSVKTDYQAPA